MKFLNKINRRISLHTGGVTGSIPVAPTTKSLIDQGVYLTPHKNKRERSNRNATRTRASNVCGMCVRNPDLFS